jgi:hypothetical protein
MGKKRKLTVFSRAPYGRWDIYHHVLWFFRSLYCAWERATKGYCYRDLWSLNWFYTQLFIDSIREFKKGLHGAPQEFFDDDKENQIERWENYLEEMAQHFYNSLEENNPDKNEFADEFHRLRLLKIEKDEHGYSVMKNHTEPEAVAIREKWFAREKELHEWRYAELNKGLDMLKENFSALWD